MSEEKNKIRNRAYSQGNLKDYLEKKRKREVRREEEQEEIVTEIFKISKKTPRTPPEKDIQSERESENQKVVAMEEVKAMFADIQKEIKEIKAANQEYRKEVELMRNELKEKEEKWEREKKVLEERIQLIEIRLEEEEKRRRRNNIIIKGLKLKEEKPEQMEKEISNLFKEEVGEEVNIKTVNKIGKETILVEMENWEQKIKIMKGKYKLMKNEGTRKIYIDNDLTKNEREIQKKIYLEAKERRKDGWQVKVGYKKIKIGEDLWSWNERKGLLEKKVF